MDILRGGFGWDNTSGGLRSDDVSGGPGRDVVTGGDAADWVIELSGDDVVNGGAGRDWLALGTGSDSLQAGGHGDLVIVLNDGDTDTFQCGDGRDVVIHAGERVDPLDRHRSCGKIVTDIDSTHVSFPPIPPIFFAVSEPEEPSQTDEKRRKAFRQMVAELRASLG